MKYEITAEYNHTGVRSSRVIDVPVGTSMLDAFLEERGLNPEEWTLDDAVPIGEDDQLDPDPSFPDRPTHPDFARLSSAVNEQDAVSDMLGIGEASSVDLESLTYLAANRIGPVVGAVVEAPTQFLGLLIAIYVDAFQLGVGFTERGGHREETGTAGEKEGSR